ncbi:MAG: hypothetical protein K8R77_12835 [Anaerolineaceae bacterium]|nr:hypothetical protein [Anaerolineaceae bacterium]
MNQSTAYFISPHGFGHAARSAAVMSALRERIPDICFEIYTLIPEWFFSEALSANYNYHTLRTDVGLIQDSPLSENALATLQALDQFLPLPLNHIEHIAQDLANRNCLCAICDISPLGILAGKRAGIPVALIENFTWDWIYENYQQANPGFSKHIKYLREIYQSPDLHILAQPYCQPNANANLKARPISRSPKKTRQAVREALNLKEGEQMILITMGGIPESFHTIDYLQQFSNITFVIPGGSSRFEHRKNLILLPHHSTFYHPDLIAACDAAVGKAGYSTIAELYNAGLPFGYFARPSFRESAFLTAFIDTNMQSIEMQGKHITDHEWLHQIPALLSLPSTRRDLPNGANQVADFLYHELLG